MTTSKGYGSVADMLCDVSGDKSLSKDFIKLVARRKVVKQLIALRMAKRMSRNAMANELGISPSRLSGIENGDDDNLRVGELRCYAKCFGVEFVVK